MKYHSLLLVAVLGGSATLAQAQLEIAGTATGLFDGVSTSYGGLTYNGSTFDVFSSAGFYALGGNPGPTNVDNLGSFTLSTLPFDYDSPATTFTVDVTFTDPTGIAGGGSTTFTAPVTGQVVNSSTGGVTINFTSPPETFTFANPTDHGVFTLVVNPLSIYPGQTESLTGYGTASFTSVPAPGAIACMALGLIGTLVRRRVRR